MNLAILVALFGVVLVSARPQADGDATILRSENENPGTGEYQWDFETSNGIKQEAKGNLRDGVLEDGSNGQFEVVEGSYSYTSPDGRLITVTYVSDEKGYRAKTTYSR